MRNGEPKQYNNVLSATYVASIFILVTPLSGCGGASGSGSGAASQPVPQSTLPGLPGTSNPIPAPAPTPAPVPATTVNTDISSSAAMVASNWEIGPIINGKNYSVGMPLNPTQTSDGWAFDFPLSPGSVHYVTFQSGSLVGKTHIVVHYRIETNSNVQLFPVCCAQLASIGPTLYFQEKGDNWSTDGMRWWATFAAPNPIQSGDYTLDVPLDGAWTSVNTMTAASNPIEFTNAKQNAARVGFTFGGGDGYGHGVYANGTARFVLESFSLE